MSADSANLLQSLDYSVLQQCMHCGMCLPTCPTYDETKRERSSPRGRIRLMRDAADGLLDVSPAFAEEMSYCLGCLACQTACPAGVQYGTLLEHARGEAERVSVAGQGLRRRLVRWLTLSVLFKRPRLLRLAGRLLGLYQQSGLQSLLRRSGVLRLAPSRLRRLEAMTPTVRAPFSHRRIQPRESPAEVPVDCLGTADRRPRFRIGLLTGCVQDLLYAHVNRATADVLLAHGCEVATPPVQFCCGSLLAHNGDLAGARELARRTLDAWQGELDRLDAVITNAGGCGSHLRKYGELLHDDPIYAARATAWDAKVRDVHEWLVEIGLRPPLASSLPQKRLRVAYDASCHLLHGQGVATPPLAVLRAIPGVDLVPLAEADWCCGSAGVYSLTQPEQADKLLARKVGHIAAATPDVLATGNPGCLLQLQLGLARDPRTAGIRVCHPVELFAEALQLGRCLAPED